MPYTVDWYIENEIIYTHFTGTTSAEEIRESMYEMRDFIEISPHPLVHIVVDVGDIVIPASLKETLPLVREVGSHPRLGWTISIREKSVLVKMISGLATSIFKQRFKSVSTLDQALAHLGDMDQTISWDRANPSVVAQLTQQSDTYPRNAS